MAETPWTSHVSAIYSAGNLCAAQVQPAGQPALSASFMILRMVRRQRPHCALQPRQRCTCTAERGERVVTAWRTSWSLNTLQEQTIIEFQRGRRFHLQQCLFRYRLN